jgi:threonine dehydratase
MAARTRGVPCEVFMPDAAPIAKVEATAALGAQVVVGGESVDDCLVAARTRAAESGMAFVHPFDDPDIVAGQGTLGLELLEDLADLTTLVVPVGGGGLASGTAIAVKSARPDVRVIGVQVETVAAYPASLKAGRPIGVAAALTIADGIAVKKPGDLTLALIDRWLDDVVVVPEDEVAEAMVLLMEKAKLVVEGAGAVGVAALLGGQVQAASTGTTCVLLSGGNVDAGLLATIARRHETEAGRRMVLLTRVPDRPGALAALLDTVAGAGANIVEVSHLREGIGLHVRETGVQLTVETRSREHAERVVGAVAAAGYGVSRYPDVA